mmetsp:Transcript_22508/g.76519  ORF Transcript_22508/g.76519 Transcript_22508/m.76519 type:complete len:294 (+) Transcript_22508:214-1095(+)
MSSRLVSSTPIGRQRPHSKHGGHKHLQLVSAELPRVHRAEAASFACPVGPHGSHCLTLGRLALSCLSKAASCGCLRIHECLHRTCLALAAALLCHGPGNCRNGACQRLAPANVPQVLGHLGRELADGLGDSRSRRVCGTVQREQRRVQVPRGHLCPDACCRRCCPAHGSQASLLCSSGTEGGHATVQPSQDASAPALVRNLASVDPITVVILGRLVPLRLLFVHVSGRRLSHACCGCAGHRYEVLDQLRRERLIQGLCLQRQAGLAREGVQTGVRCQEASLPACLAPVGANCC